MAAVRTTIREYLASVLPGLADVSGSARRGTDPAAWK